MGEIVETIGSGVGIVLVVVGAVALLAYVFRGRARAAAALLAVPAMMVVGPMSATAVTETNPTFELIPSDLEFILAQIEISEAHAAAEFGPNPDPNYSLLCADPTDVTGKCVPDASLPWGLRTVDGSFNNLTEGGERIGAGNEVMPRLLPIQWRDADDAPPPPAPPGGTSPACDVGSTCYEQTSGIVYDSDPRVISNLIVDNSTNNPAAVDAAAANPDSVILPNNDVYLPNIMADEGLSAPVNLWFVFFGQFFDHGLDMVNKGSSGQIIVPLNPDDPLYVEGAPTNFMMLDRATNRPGPDGIVGNADDIREHENRTTPWVDQNQTYTSHPAHHVFLREYAATGPNGAPEATGRLLNGAGGVGLATWDDVKAQANDLLGINLVDEDVLAVPQVLVDYYGNFIPDGNGMPQLVTNTGVVSGDLQNPVDTTDAINLNQAFLDDIAHGAVPNELAGYDNVLLGQHFVTGDGRGNENIGLTSVHHVFHSEHNRMVEAVKATLDANPALQAAYESSGEADDWSYNERVFQAARFATEMQYQHLVFEEFARTIQPGIDVVGTYDSTVDASIRAEFAHVVYRFGHSMLTEDIDRTGFGAESASLLDGFLNPVAWRCRVQPDANNVCPDPGTNLMSPDEAAGAVVNGTTDQAANQVDELVTSTLRNSLLGLPLDLAAINIMRGRDTGMPPLQVARQTFFDATGNPQLEPYSSWADYNLSLRNGNNFGRGDSQASLINFIAAYGTHPTVVAETTLDGKRAAAEAIVNGTPTSSLVGRVAGTDRYATAAAVSRSNFPTTAPVVYVANGLNFPDALAGGPGASIDGAPLLLLDNNSIPTATAVELGRLQPNEIVILGGTGVVSQAVEDDLATNFGATTRVSGTDRYSTAAAISQRAFPAGAGTVYIASGANFPDALSGGVAAAANGAPLLLVRPSGALPAATAAELSRLGVTDIKVLGGPGAIGADTEAALALFGTVERLAGTNRYETSIAISQATYANGIGGTVYLATGVNFPDALAAAPAGSPLLLVPGQSATLPANIEAELLRLDPDQVVLLGGPNAINAGLEAAVSALFPLVPAPADRTDFLNSTGTWSNGLTGLEDVDFWVGGLAEAVEPFGGMLGSTFNEVFEKQLEDLQFGDRFYYLFRNVGNQLFAGLEANTFSSLIQRNSDASLLPASIFSVQDPFIDLENLPNPLPTQLSQAPNGTWTWDGDQHTEIHGNRTLADLIQGGQGDDALFGYGGNDRIEGGSGNDSIVGGDGDDILTDSFGDDNIKGGHGNDAIDIGPGIADLALGGPGNDFVTKAIDDSAVGFLGTGNDVFLGGAGAEAPVANEGDDWLEGGANGDILIGDNANPFENAIIGGNDVMLGGPGADDLDGEGGDDITVGAATNTASVDGHHGLFGWDFATYYGTTTGVNADMNFQLGVPAPVDRDRFLQTEAMSGGSGNDVLRGLGFDPVDPADQTGEEVNFITEESMDLVTGLRDLLQPGAANYAERFRTLGSTGNLLMGGPGSDLIEGRAGDDFIDGDSQVRVRLQHGATVSDTASVFRAGVFNGTLNPGGFTIVRDLIDGDVANVATDTAEYQSNFDDVTIVDLGNGHWEVTTPDQAAADLDPLLIPEGADILTNVERIQFGTDPINGVPCFVDLAVDPTVCNPGTAPAALAVQVQGTEVTATLDLGNGGGVSAQSAPAELQMTVQELNAEGSWVPVTGDEVTTDALAQTLTVPDGTEGDLRVVANFIDGDGVLQGVTSEVLPSN